MDDIRIYWGGMVVDLVLPHAQSMKDWRRALQALIQRLRNHRLSVAQVGPADLRQRVFLAVAAVAGTASGLDGLLDQAERVIFASEFEVADLRRDMSQESFHSG